MILVGCMIIFTGLLSAALTWGLAYALYRWRLQQQIDSMIDTLQDEFEQRVRTGVYSAGTELLPQLREQVKLGFQDALRASPTTLVENAASVVTAGTDLVTNGIGTLFGIKPKSQ